MMPLPVPTRITATNAVLKMSPQGGGQGIRSTTTAAPGGSVTVNVGPNDPSVSLTNNATGDSSSFPVDPGKDTTIPIPNVPGGTILTITVGSGQRARIIIVEVITPGP